MGLSTRLTNALAGASQLVRAARLSVLRAGAARQFERPNAPEEWADIYQGVDVAVDSLNSTIAKAVAAESAVGDCLLEAGCGSGQLSAELATAGRTIHLCDFSPRILERAVRLFQISGLPAPTTTLADITKRLPWPDRSIDIVWSSGVLEHWTDEELHPIVSEMARICRKRVISIVPNARSVLYRIGKHLCEQEGLWPYGRELPRASLAAVFERAGLISIREFTIWPEHVPNFLATTDPHLAKLIFDWWQDISSDDPVFENQGYLLVTIGEPRYQ